MKINKEKDKALQPVSEWGFGGGGLGRVKNLDPGVESDDEEEVDDLLETVHHDLMIPHPRRDILHSRSVEFYFAQKNVSFFKEEDIPLLLCI